MPFHTFAKTKQVVSGSEGIKQSRLLKESYFFFYPRRIYNDLLFCGNIAENQKYRENM